MGKKKVNTLDKRPHPMQPVGADDRGVVRFKPNKIVQKLLDFGQSKGYGLNEIAVEAFEAEDRRQLAQLIGYSVGGYSGLSYVSTLDAAMANAANANGRSVAEVRLALLEKEVEALKKALREPIARLYDIHPSDLGGGR